MRTCKYCGCYLPDGATECLACGNSNDRDENRYGVSSVQTVRWMEYDPVCNGLKEGRYDYIVPTIGYGKSVDAKPKDVADKSIFHEIDTGNSYRFDHLNHQWVRQYGFDDMVKMIEEYNDYIK